MSEFSRETLLNIIETDHVQCGEASALARMALAAMDSESGCLPLDYLQGHKDGLEWAAQLAEANHHETGDWLYDDPIELAKAIRKGPDMPPAQPVADSEPVAVIDLANLDYLLSGADADVWPPEREEMGDVLLYRHPQPAPVVPDDVLAALQKVARIRLDLNDFDGDRRGIADCLGDAEEALIEVVNRRAAMLAAAPQSPGSEPATVPGKWIPVSEQMPPSRHEVLVGRWWGEKPRWCCKWATYIPGHPDAQSSGWLIPGASWTPTHWMPLPAAPQEVK
ncbi:DUF551 domain-containing protein [Klebsiella pneumoniae]|uniref:DUF551 domain-containing protein n=1 Tax=Klebsiella pneumoniae TaxID=573 RepID=UPI001E6561B9|nr:DUF551 domain-containing protein [Klebsiella pneumoniae]